MFIEESEYEFLAKLKQDIWVGKQWWFANELKEGIKVAYGYWVLRIKTYS